MNDMHIDFKAAQSWSEIQGSLSSYSVLYVNLFYMYR